MTEFTGTLIVSEGSEGILFNKKRALILSGLFFYFVTSATSRPKLSG